MPNSKVIQFDDIRNLRSKTEQSYVQSKFKNSLFGGFDKQDVFDFIKELNEKEQNAQNVFNSHINELSCVVDEIKNERDILSLRLAEAISLKKDIETELINIKNDYAISLRKVENYKAETLIVREKCNEYEQNLEILLEAQHENEALKAIESRFDELQQNFEQLAISREEYAKSNAILIQENTETKNTNAIIMQENKACHQKINELISEIRSYRLKSELEICESSEKNKFIIETAIKNIEASLLSIKEVKNQTEIHCEGFKNNLDSLKGIER
jgi:uncharacterized protein YqgQ